MNTQAWLDATNEHLRDIDSLNDWIYDNLRRQPNVDESASKALSDQLFMDQPLKATPPWTVAQLLYVAFADPDDSVRIKALDLVKETYAKHASCAISKLFWKSQDAEQEMFEMDDDS